MKSKIGVVCLARKTFDFKAAEEIFKSKVEELKKIDYVDFKIYDELVIDVEDLERVYENIKEIDGLIIISGTFHLGHLAISLQKKYKVPILLWAFNELPYDGGKIRLNSVCGLNLNASNLYKSGVDNFHYVIGERVDEDWLKAINMKKAISDSKIGILGNRAHGFFNLSVDELNLFGNSGTIVDYYQLNELYDLAKNADEKVYEEEISKVYEVSSISKEQLKKVSKLTYALKKFLDEKKLAGVAIRCWPEFAGDYGISPCAAMSYLQAKGYITGCEGDLEGTLSMIAAKAASNKTPFLADLSQVDLEKDETLLWHCGVAPANLWDGKSNRSLDTYFAGGKGVTADFVLKEGEITILRIDSARGKTRVFAEKGKAFEMEKLLKGTYAKVKFEKPVKDVLDRLITNGIAHHVAMVYGDYYRTYKIFAKIMNWQFLG
ncbi:L-fucose isomerase-like protein [Thermosipho africanus Ob7]|uniref:L-fucose/L-arabinose isomerase family protein n=1 Tax=Thermosipho africanus TaxID=2421 RepID=UPI000E0C1A79|nr:fucose isomerase [Thermosipho africanus]RDI90875.1 L-fucose isomerase-like protein [Thermosipho africanus Ob7]